MIRSLFRCRRLYSNLLDTKRNCIRPGFELHFDAASRKSFTQNINKLLADHRISNNDPATHLATFIHEKLNCSEEETIKLCVHHLEFMNKKATDVIQIIELLLGANVRPDVILDNFNLISLSTSQISTNLKILQDMEPKNINDFIPLIGVSTAKLLKLKKRAKREEDFVPNKHRIYYMSSVMNVRAVTGIEKYLKIEASIVAKFISQRLFVLDIPFETLDNALNLLLRYIAPMDILKDLWAFRYPLEQIEDRLILAQQGQKNKLMPWMIRCPESKLLKSIKITAESKAIMGNDTTVEYLAERLGYSIAETDLVMRKHPQVFTVRVTRMKKMLDYLLGEARFTKEDIAKTPRIFCHSLVTTKKRLEELNSMGCRPLSLTILCKSANNYEKFVRNWENKRNALTEINAIKQIKE
ncbi:Transcription termination factor, mitochondrial [Pseudolycoriella hygida]|uniref:Transcription termination factor, mitochondrial n=1 Tax=Pseudolycoriella hygida TaxID=35572 RepID=A0A9Q0MYH7_9DIPT|nr:Transcription termination factor, mitochondrial [Pseudolycoriella hygida]